MGLFKHVCGNENHYFEPRYDSEMPRNGFTAERCTVSLVEAVKTNIYRGDVCIYCGKIVNDKNTRNEI